MKRFLILIPILIVITNCGYSALYKDNSKLLKYKINIVVKTESKLSKDKQIIKNYLLKRLSSSKSRPSSLKLVISMQKNVYSLGLQKDLTNTRSAVNYNISYTFYDRIGILSRGSLQKSTSFNVGESPYANIVAEDTSSLNLLKSLSNDISLMVMTLPIKRKIYP